ncbi:MAG: FAD-binding protein, partial [Candidatus Heimdallarchaeaceae archaeon]
EKLCFYGGSTALSGGGIWVPNNFALKRAGIEDSPELAMSYLDAIIGSRVPSKNKKAYVEQSSKMIDWLRSNTCLKFIRVPWYSDYHPNVIGGLAEGRSLEVKPFNGRKLKKDLKFLNKSIFEVPLGIAFTISEYHDLGMFMSTWRGKWTAIKVGLKTVINLLLRVKLLTMGQALIGRLRKAMKDFSIPLWLNAPLTDLIIENQKVIGAVVERNGIKKRIFVKKGIILAAGGFAHNLEMRKKYQPKPVSTDWTVASKGNTGDTILIGMKIGAAVDLLDDAWWGPTSLPPNEPPFFHVGERGYPGSIMINKKGKRFTNESASYVVVSHEIFKYHSPEDQHIPCYFIFDQRFKNTYIFGTTFPGQKFPKEYFETGYIKKAYTLEELAEIIEVDKENFLATIERFNGFAITGKDEDFGRGENAYDNYYGDPKVRPNPNLAPITHPPFYAVEMVPGDLGTKGGLVTNEYAQVLRKDGKVIEGLYAIGNNSASVMGNSYPGPGGTIGPSMTFGFIAAKHLVRKK